MPCHFWVQSVYAKFDDWTVLISDSVVKIFCVSLLCNLIIPASIYIFGFASLIWGTARALRVKRICEFVGAITIAHMGVLLLSSCPGHNFHVLFYQLTYSLCSVCILWPNSLKSRLLGLIMIPGLPFFPPFWSKLVLFYRLANDKKYLITYLILLFFVFEMIIVLKFLKQWSLKKLTQSM